MSQERVQFAFELESSNLESSNGGALQGQGFRLGIGGDDIDDAALAA